MNVRSKVATVYSEHKSTQKQVPYCEGVAYSRLLQRVRLAQGWLTMQPAKHGVTGMPLYQIYPYPICSSMLVLLVNTISKIILKSFEKFC